MFCIGLKAWVAEIVNTFQGHIIENFFFNKISYGDWLFNVGVMSLLIK